MLQKELWQQLIDSKIEKVGQIPLLAVLKIEITILAEERHYGPATIDYALRCLANHLKSRIRQLDSCTRSGNELTLVMPKTSAKEARHASRRVAELIRKYLAESGFKVANINTGVATLSETDDAESLFWNAEEDLKQAKRRSRLYDFNQSFI